MVDKPDIIPFSGSVRLAGNPPIIQEFACQPVNERLGGFATMGRGVQDGLNGRSTLPEAVRLDIDTPCRESDISKTFA
jgi:hypothetical protein